MQMVGDRLETDIRMGIAAGMATCLVLTGDATQETLVASGLQPTLILERDPIDFWNRQAHNDCGHDTNLHSNQAICCIIIE